MLKSSPFFMDAAPGLSIPVGAGEGVMVAIQGRVSLPGDEQETRQMPTARTASREKIIVKVGLERGDLFWLVSMDESPSKHIDARAGAQVPGNTRIQIYYSTRAWQEPKSHKKSQKVTIHHSFSGKNPGCYFGSVFCFQGAVNQRENRGTWLG